MTTSVVSSGVLVTGDEDDPLARRFRQLMTSAPQEVESVAWKVWAALNGVRFSSKRLTKLIELAESTHNDVPLLVCVADFAFAPLSAHPQFRLWQDRCRAVLTEALAL